MSRILALHTSVVFFLDFNLILNIHMSFVKHENGVYVPIIPKSCYKIHLFTFSYIGHSLITHKILKIKIFCFFAILISHSLIKSMYFHLSLRVTICLTYRQFIDSSATLVLSLLFFYFGNSPSC